MTSIAIDKVLSDTRLLGAALGDIETWATWTIALKAAFALPLDDKEREVFKVIAGDRGLPKQRVRELWCTIGRRGGKSRMAAALAIYFALFVRHRLAAGEKGLVLVLSATVEQSKVVFSYVLGFLRASEVLAKEIESTTAHEIRLRNGITIAVHPNSFRTCAAGRYARASSMKLRFGAMTRPRRPTPRPTLRCCPRCSRPEAC
jgi:hypothetical protein